MICAPAGEMAKRSVSRDGAQPLRDCEACSQICERAVERLAAIIAEAIARLTRRRGREAGFGSLPPRRRRTRTH
jgi:hypothetical protein